MKRLTVSENKKRNKRALQYGAGIFAFALLIVSALWLPQVFFELSDALMYGEISRMEQEKPDVLTLTTGYEESLYRRLSDFAEGLAGQTQYYVDEQPKEVTEEIREFLFGSELHFYANGIYEDVIVGMLLESLGFSPESFARKTELELYQWNQYVIYSDDYARGVNFILWCFGLKNSSGDNLTILMDAHDYTVYALEITGGGEDSVLSAYLWHKSTEYAKMNAAAEEKIIHASSLYTWGSIWTVINAYYEIFEMEELERCFLQIVEMGANWNENKDPPTGIAGVMRDCAGNKVEIYLDADSDVPYGADGEGWWYGRGAGDTLYYSLPFKENKITFDMHSFGMVYDTYQTTGSTMGIREIYELIPEFQHSG